MPKHQYEELWFPLHPFDFKQIKSPSVRKVAREFRKKCEHIHDMIGFPIHVINMATKDEAVRIKLRAEQLIHGDTVEMSVAEIDTVAAGMLNELLMQEILDLNMSARARHRCCLIFLSFIKRFGLGSELQGTYLGMILRGWAAIEVTLKKLYAVVVSSSARAQTNSSKQVTSAAKRINQKQLNRRGITAYSAKKPKDKVGFTSLVLTREAYSMLFDIDHRLIDSALSSLHLDSLALIRNLFVHNALVPDQQFRDSGQNIPTLRRFMKPSCKTVKINARFTRLLVNRAFLATDKLILAVDKWLQKHP